MFSKVANAILFFRLDIRMGLLYLTLCIGETCWGCPIAWRQQWCPQALSTHCSCLSSAPHGWKSWSSLLLRGWLVPFNAGEGCRCQEPVGKGGLRKHLDGEGKYLTHGLLCLGSPGCSGEGGTSSQTLPGPSRHCGGLRGLSLQCS